MKFTSLSAFATFITFVMAQTADPSINTPVSLTTCQPSQLTFSGTHPPFILSVIPAGNPAAPPLVELGTFTSSPFTWNVNLGAGTAITLHIKDSLGVDGFSGQVTILGGSDTSCVGKPLSSAGGAPSVTLPGTGAPGASTPAVPPPVSTPVSTPPTVSTPVSTPASSGAATPSSSPAASSSPTKSAAPAASSNAATSNVAGLGFAGVLGLFGAAVLA